MPTFGFSYFLKLLCLNQRPQATQVRIRLSPSVGGYDYHRSLRLRIQRALMHSVDFEDVIASTSEIRRPSERNSAREGLIRLRAWRGVNFGPLSTCSAATWLSPRAEFKVRFEPDFGIEIGGRLTAVHVWNSLRPALDDRMVYAALSLLPAAYSDEREVPEDFAVLSLQTGRLYRLSDAADHSLLASRLVEALDRLIAETRERLKRTDDRPPGSPSQPSISR